MIRTLLSVLVLALGFSASAVADDFGRLRPFKTDGCTRFPDGTPSEPRAWQMCCVRHDLKYWAGGVWDERRQADLELKDCVARSGHPDVAELMYLGVRMGGTGRFKTAFRWGYGWPKRRGYAPLSADEFRQVQMLLPADLSAVPITAEEL